MCDEVVQKSQRPFLMYGIDLQANTCVNNHAFRTIMKYDRTCSASGTVKCLIAVQCGIIV